MKKAVLLSLVGALMFSVCSCNQTESTTIEPSISETTEQTSETTTGETTIETTVETTTEETTTTETTEHSPVLKLKQMEFNGTLPDGEYFATIYSFDEDGSGAKFNVRGYWVITEDEFDNALVGDTIIMGEKEYEITHKNPSASYYGIQCSDLCGTQKQRNGLYYIRGWSDEIYTYSLAHKYHISFASSIEIYSDVNIYGDEELFWEESTKGKRYSSPFKYNTTQEFIRDANENGEIYGGCHLVIENGLVTKIYINPQLHEAWMSEKIWKKYHS